MHYGIPDAYTEPMFTTRVFVFLLLDLDTCFRT